MTHTARVCRPKNLQIWLKLKFFGFFEGGAFALLHLLDPPLVSAARRGILLPSVTHKKVVSCCPKQSKFPDKVFIFSSDHSLTELNFVLGKLNRRIIVGWIFRNIHPCQQEVPPPWFQFPMSHVAVFIQYLSLLSRISKPNSKDSSISVCFGNSRWNSNDLRKDSRGLQIKYGNGISTEISLKRRQIKSNHSSIHSEIKPRKNYGLITGNAICNVYCVCIWHSIVVSFLWIHNNCNEQFRISKLTKSSKYLMVKIHRWYNFV